MIQAVLEQTAQKFSLSEQELIEEGVKAFLQNQLRIIETERQQIFSKYSVNNLEELDSYVCDHPDSESDLLPVLQKVDELTARIDEIKRMLINVNGND